MRTGMHTDRRELKIFAAFIFPNWIVFDAVGYMNYVYIKRKKKN